jgi:starch synthase
VAHLGIVAGNSEKMRRLYSAEAIHPSKDGKKPRVRPMKIVFVAAEMSPLAKVGGLADVIGSLPKALRRLGVDARVLLPHYRMVDAALPAPAKESLEPFPVRMNRDWTQMATFHETEVDGVPVGLIGTDRWFNESVSSETLYQPGGDQHLFFCNAALEAMDLLSWSPDVVHGHDWHTGFLPVLMREKKTAAWDRAGAVFTIHNFAYQGLFGHETLDRLELPHSLYNPHQLETWGRVNFLKAGCVFSDAVSTVSRSYAREIQTPEYGCSLDGLMRHLCAEGRLTGILNGIDTEEFNPSTDRHLPANYSASDMSGKQICRRNLQEELGLAKSTGPLCGVVSRLSSQKGLDLLAACAPAMIDMSAQLVVQGLGEPAIAEQFKALEAKYPKRVRLVNQFDASLAQRVYAGSDLFMMPSRFEPCGLGQMIAMRYGTLPLVRATGGLKDTVSDGQNGFVFKNENEIELLEAFQRASAAFKDKSAWRALKLNAMMQDFSWDKSAKEYVTLYQSCVARRMATSA